MSELYEKITKLIDLISKDYRIVEDDGHGKKTAAKRVRANSLELQKLLKDFRIEALKVYKKD